MWQQPQHVQAIQQGVRRVVRPQQVAQLHLQVPVVAEAGCDDVEAQGDALPAAAPAGHVEAGNGRNLQRVGSTADVTRGVVSLVDTVCCVGWG